MRFLIFALFFSSVAAFAEPNAKIKAEADGGKRPPFLVGVRGGFLLQNQDAAVVSKWEHKAAESYQVVLSGYWNFPRAWKQIYFFAGPEFAYQNQTEELSGQTYTATLDISAYRFYLTGGVTFQPDFATGWGLSLATAFEVWGQKTAALDSAGITQDLGTESSRSGLGLNVHASVFYDFGSLRPQLVLESNSAIGLGVAYAF